MALGQAGADIALVARNKSGLERVSASLAGLGRESLTIPSDISETQAASRIVDSVLKWKGRIDILINNAGIVVRGPAEEFTDDGWSRVMRTNLDAAFFMAREAGKVKIQNRSGKIVNIGSINSVISSPNLVSYTASKGGIAQMTKALAVEWARYNIQVNCVLPGYIPTDLNTAVHSDPERYASIAKRITAGRWGKPEDLHGIVVFLASRASDYVTGIAVPVDGGYLAT
jgi:NAD(P)-dependent dehydrogenase (short-subunit alcohol dehydrogenase family)